MPSSRPAVLIVFLILFFALASAATGCGAGKAPSGEKVVGTVEFCNQSSEAKVFLDGHSFQARTSSGEFVLHNVPPGDYELVMELPTGYVETREIQVEHALLNLGILKTGDNVSCAHICDDGHPCTDDLYAYNDQGHPVCDNPPLPDNTPCIEGTHTCQNGECVPCSAMVNPVCGADGNTYTNSCLAYAAGTTPRYPSPCGLIE